MVLPRRVEAMGVRRAIVAADIVRHRRAATTVLHLAIAGGTAVRLTVVGQRARALRRTAAAAQCRRITDRRHTVVAVVDIMRAARRRITGVEAAVAALTAEAEVADRTAEVAEATPAVIANL